MRLGQHSCFATRARAHGWAALALVVPSRRLAGAHGGDDRNQAKRQSAVSVGQPPSIQNRVEGLRDRVVRGSDPRHDEHAAARREREGFTAAIRRGVADGAAPRPCGCPTIDLRVDDAAPRSAHPGVPSLPLWATAGDPNDAEDVVDISVWAPDGAPTELNVSWYSEQPASGASRRARPRGRPCA
jgi:hypothetical protein